MADEREQGHSPLDTIESVGKAALAVGAGAALLYRSGGSELLSSGFRKASRALNDTLNTVSKTALRDMDAEFFSGVASRVKSTLSENDETINLRPNSAKSIFNILQERFQLTQNRSKFLYQMYDKGEMLYSLKADLQHQFGNNDSVLNRRVENFVDDVVSNLDDAVKYEDEMGGYVFSEKFLGKHFSDDAFSQEQQQAMQESIIAAMNRKKQEVEQFVREHSPLVDAMANKMVDIDLLSERFGMLGRETKSQKFFDTLLGDHLATVNDILAHRDSDVVNNQLKSLRSTQDVLDVLERLVDEDPMYGNLFVDNTLRVNNEGKLYSFSEAADAVNKLANEFSETLPGKLFKTRDIHEARNAPNFYYTAPGEASPLLTKVAEGRDSSLTSQSYAYILGKTYRLNDDNTLEHISALDDYYLMSGKHGTGPRVLKNLVGDIDRKALTDNKFLSALDIQKSVEPSALKGALSFFTKFSDERWGRNLVGSFLYADTNQVTGMLEQFASPADDQARVQASEFIGNYFDKLKKLNSFFSKTTNNLDRSTVNKLHDATSGRTKEFMRMLTLNDQDFIREIMNQNTDYLHNPELISMMKRYLTNSKKTVDMVSIISDKKNSFGVTRGVRFTELLRKEVAKEAFLTYKRANGGNASLLRLFDVAGVEGHELKEAKYLANWGTFQQVSGVYSSTTRPRAIEHLANSITETQYLFSGKVPDDVYHPEEVFLKSFRENMEQMSKEKASVLQSGFQKETDVIPGHSFGDYTYMKKAIGPMTLLKNMNDSTMWRAALKQFNAGRRDMQNITTATMFPYFTLLRLVDPVASLGMAFSPKSMGSSLDLASSIFFKRVLPIAGAFTALSYLDFESQNFTGTSLTGAAANSLANIDLAGRRAIDALGLGQALKTHYALNPMSQYWNDQEYQSYDERVEWYKNGYSPVRKGRWWSFGSASEFRGGKIEYFEPNYLRQAHSDWRDIGIYGSEDEKWKHSWIPTPRHPLSTLRALADPYWLENKHYWDRPYPVTGKLFDEGTPWGAILNPTVGQIVKPQRKMHQAELGNTMVDVRSLIAQRNAEVYQKANANNSLVKLTGDGFTPVSYTALGAPTPTQRVVTTSGASGAYVSGLDYTAMSISDYEPIHDALQARAVAAGEGVSYGTGGSGSGGGGTTESGKLSFMGRLTLSAVKGNPAAAMISNSLPLDLIEELNNRTVSRANASGVIAPKGGDQGVIINDAIYKEKASWGSLGGVTEGDLRNVTSTKQFLEDAGYSTRELLGMYGFLYEAAFPSQKSYRLQSADRMNSFSRAFWDQSLGGWGGEFMEIARRFIPHEEHSVERINNIKNTMPDWMPARFQYGDPYEKVPKGELRLPGAGYEDMYSLHPDQYGKYGAFDRMKILADIAPWSREYRLWREIASKTIEDEGLKTEMEKIKERVEEQSKQHEFFPYKFIGSELSSKSTVITGVTNTGFTVYGEDKTYRMAGINITQGKLTDYLKPGMSVTVKFGEEEANQKAVNAIVYTDGENLNKKLLDSKSAEVSKDTSAAGLHARFTASQIEQGKMWELIAHAPIPLLHNKFMRVNSPLESWKDEELYGTSYSTWNHPIQGFIVPAFQQAFAVNHAHMALGAAAWVTSELLHHSKGNVGNVAKGASTLAMLALNPGAFAGAATGFAVKLNKDYVHAGARIGAIVGLAGYTYVNSRNPIFASIGGTAIGYQVAEQLWKGTGKKGAIVGLAAGIALSGMKNPGWDSEKMFGPWVPKRVQKRWEIEEYYDRLKYIKYMGLYEKAARIANFKEHTDIKRIVNKFERDSEQREKIKQQLLASRELVSNTYAGGDTRTKALLNEIDAKTAALSYPQQILKAGKYTKAALAYKQAAESTIYGLKQNATWSQILRAVPTYERDYVLEFGKETDPKKRKEILKYMAPYRRRVLQALWGEKQDKVESNGKFFATHKLPGLFWSGWQPDVDLDNVKIKTIKNEGMLLSDFGFYDSQAEEPEAQAAPSVSYNQNTAPIELRKNLIGALTGSGLIGVDVSIEPSSKPGIQMVANIARIGDYQIKQKLNDFVGRIFY